MLTKSGPLTAAAGSHVLYNLTYQNFGPATVSSAKLVDTLARRRQLRVCLERRDVHSTTRNASCGCLPPRAPEAEPIIPAMANPLLSEGPIPVVVHGVIEYAAGILFIAAPLLFDDFQEALALSIVLGIVILLIAATTAGPTGLVNGLSLTVHVVLDYVLAVVLIAAPFIFGFSDETTPTVFFIALGVVHLLLTVGTRFQRRSAGRT